MPSTDATPSASSSTGQPPAGVHSARPGRRCGARVLSACAAAIEVFGLFAVAVRLFPPTDGPLALLASFIPYGIFAHVAALVLLLAALVVSGGSQRGLVPLALAVAALLTAQIGWLLPLFARDDRPATTPTFTVLSLNMRSDGADPRQVVALAKTADIVVLVEFRPPTITALQSLGMDRDFPYRIGKPPYSYNGSTIYSRFPLSDPKVVLTSFPQWSATAAIPGVGDVRIAAAHPCNPFCGRGKWPGEAAALRQSLRSQLDQPLLVAGDFNAVDDHAPMRALRTLGLTSATDIAGAGWLPSYPANATIPPMLPIDHIMLSAGLTATSIRTVQVDGTDHLGLIATIAGTSR